MAACKEELSEELDPSQFCCSVCLDLLKDPVTIPCGHSYCKVCIESFWDQNEEKGNCTCPQCRETFNPRPVLRRSTMLAEVVEMLKRKGTQQPTPSLPEACTGPEDVPCDFCCGTNPRKATMSCLTCMASYCPVHIESHYNVPVLKKHQLVLAIVPLQEKMCTKHNKLMEVYCRWDKKCICYLCNIDEHKRHQTVSTAAERIEQQKQLSVNQEKVQERGKEREKELTELLKALKDFKESTQAAVETSDKDFEELISRTLMKQLIWAQEKTALAQAERLQLRLEEEIVSLKKRDSELEQISLIDDHIHFIKVVEMLKRKGTQQPTPSLPEACTGPEDVPCDFCCGTNPRKATMSCLTCMASYCPVHIESHYNVPVLKKHQLVLAIVPLQEKMCTKHNKLMEVYCRWDKKCICYLCNIDEHKRHQTVSTAAERIEQQKQLSVNQEKVQERGKEREKELTELLKALKDFKESTQTAVETSDKDFEKLISLLTEKRTLMKQLIWAQEKTALAQAERLQLRLEKEIVNLKKRDSELEQISLIDDHIHFIKTFQSLSASCESPDLPDGCVVHSRRTFKEVNDRLFKLMNDMEGLLKRNWPIVTSTMSAVKVLKPLDLKTREDFLHYSRPLKLDERAVSKNLTLSQDHLRATCKMDRRCNYYSVYVNQRITKTEQVWCCEGLTERCYWEVSFYGSTWCVAVSYKDKNETSSYHSVFGQDKRSWSLERDSSVCSYRHNNKSTKVSDSLYSQIGVYLDYVEGILAFYAVNGSTMTLLHRVKNIFTEPLYPCIGFIDNWYQKDTVFYAELIKI